MNKQEGKTTIRPEQLLEAIRPETRRAYQEWIAAAGECDSRHHVARKKFLRAAQQAMELADGEKPWVGLALTQASEWVNKKGSPFALFRILLHYDCKVGGGPHQRGRPVYFQICFDRQLEEIRGYVGGAGKSDANVSVGD